eukprot:CAMPEP_0173441704 /NCGR_PEP_ID=MMETSP1357-20121228/24099_1 /TAXON_ID=77926 /ORGANISM="Hemiselmis rufescens, Strain PCC563" /LENGTH=165 /DNA_ID=CAMNT_0014407299 /DNA_START=12 /DNA_END=505 /DNA_ORIENTATION=+
MGVQLYRLQGTMMLIETHMNTIQGVELDKSILDTLRASGDALKRLGVESGVQTAEDVVADVQNQVDAAAEITSVIASGSISGVMSMGGADGMDEEELQRELNELLDEDTSETAFMSRISTLGQSAQVPPLQNMMQTEAALQEPKGESLSKEEDHGKQDGIGAEGS